jgi:hypothetical protein
MDDDDLRRLMSAHPALTPNRAAFAHWAKLSGRSLHEVRALYRGLRDGARRGGGAPEGPEIDPLGDF